jgi:hypothetical protein
MGKAIGRSPVRLSVSSGRTDLPIILPDRRPPRHTSIPPVPKMITADLTQPAAQLVVMAGAKAGADSSAGSGRLHS